MFGPSRRARALAASVVLLPSLAGAVGPTIAPGVADPSPEMRSGETADALILRLREALRELEAGEFASADGLLSEIVDKPQFARLPAEVQMFALFSNAAAAASLGDLQRAWTLAERANAGDEPLPNALAFGFELAVDLKRDREAVALLERLTIRSPETARRLRSFAIDALAERLRARPEQHALRVTFLQSLHTAEWRRPDSRQPSALWLELTGLLLDAGDTAGAIAVARDITAPEQLVTLAVEHRFHPVFAALPDERRDIGAAVDRELDELRAAMQAKPDSLEIVMYLGNALNRAGRFAEMLAVCDAALQRLAATSDAAPYEDAATYGVWIHDNRARALVALGRVDEAIAVWEAARRMPESGRPNVSQALNLAGLYGRLGRQQETLESLSSVQEASPFGWMQYHSARHVAFASTPDHPMAAESLQYLREHVRHAPAATVRALLRSNRLDDAAAVLITQMDDPELRSDLMLDVQRWRPRTHLPDAVELNARWDALLARSDVQAAIAKHGRVIDVPLLPGGL
jgi:tetratricopeptide (TPR) repeat protein